MKNVLVVQFRNGIPPVEVQDDIYNQLNCIFKDKGYEGMVMEFNDNCFDTSTKYIVVTPYNVYDADISDESKKKVYDIFNNKMNDNTETLMQILLQLAKMHDTQEAIAEEIRLIKEEIK